VPRTHAVGLGRDGVAAALLRPAPAEEAAHAVCHYPLDERSRASILELPPMIEVEPPAHVASLGASASANGNSNGIANANADENASESTPAANAENGEAASAGSDHFSAAASSSGLPGAAVDAMATDEAIPHHSSTATGSATATGDATDAASAASSSAAAPSSEPQPEPEPVPSAPPCHCTLLRSECVEHALWQETRRAEIAQLINFHRRRSQQLQLESELLLNRIRERENELLRLYEIAAEPLPPARGLGAATTGGGGGGADGSELSLEAQQQIFFQQQQEQDLLHHQQQQMHHYNGNAQYQQQQAQPHQHQQQPNQPQPNKKSTKRKAAAAAAAAASAAAATTAAAEAEAAHAHNMWQQQQQQQHQHELMLQQQHEEQQHQLLMEHQLLMQQQQQLVAQQQQLQDQQLQNFQSLAVEHPLTMDMPRADSEAAALVAADSSEQFAHSASESEALATEMATDEPPPQLLVEEAQARPALEVDSIATSEVGIALA
jgi:hypothetical protein